MGSFSPIHWILIVLVIVLLFGGGRVSGLMGDVAKGIKSFKKGMADDSDDVPPAKPAQRIEQRGETVEQSKTKDEQKLDG
ncbi:MAG: twin-arginine translocase TatA/TatE family subunit [Sphingobium sp.]|nr:twin-arginine translocase TatA/TatE family subunit [Sphingobium sp.]